MKMACSGFRPIRVGKSVASPNRAVRTQDATGPVPHDLLMYHDKTGSGVGKFPTPVRIRPSRPEIIPVKVKTAGGFDIEYSHRLDRVVSSEMIVRYQAGRKYVDHERT
jgi:hypothetical protein